MLGIGEDPPFVVPPGTKRDTILDKKQFIEDIAKKSGGPFFARDWPIFNRRPTAIYIVAHLESGMSVSARVEEDLEHELFAAERDAESTKFSTEVA